MLKMQNPGSGGCGSQMENLDLHIVSPPVTQIFRDEFAMAFFRRWLGTEQTCAIQVCGLDHRFDLSLFQHGDETSHILRPGNLPVRPRAEISLQESHPDEAQEATAVFQPHIDDTADPSVHE